MWNSDEMREFLGTCLNFIETFTLKIKRFISSELWAVPTITQQIWNNQTMKLTAFKGRIMPNEKIKWEVRWKNNVANRTIHSHRTANRFNYFLINLKTIELWNQDQLKRLIKKERRNREGEKRTGILQSILIRKLGEWPT